MKLYIESSENGHDEIDVPKGEEQKAVEGQLKDDKWVTLEQQDESSEILTEEDIPEEEEEELDNEDKELMKEAGDWKGAFKSDKGSKPYKPTPELQKAKTTVREEWESKFENVKSACSTNKAKGG